MNTSISISLFFAGFFDIALFVFHMFFWKLFRWETQLKKVSTLNKGVMQVMNLALMVMFLLFSYLLFFEANNLIETSFGRTILIGIAFFWFMRTLFQPIFFGCKNLTAAAFIGIFATGSLLHILPIALFLNQ